MRYIRLALPLLFLIVLQASSAPVKTPPKSLEREDSPPEAGTSPKIPEADQSKGHTPQSSQDSIRMGTVISIAPQQIYKEKQFYGGNIPHPAVVIDRKDRVKNTYRVAAISHSLPGNPPRGKLSSLLPPGSKADGDVNYSRVGEAPRSKIKPFMGGTQIVTKEGLQEIHRNLEANKDWLADKAKQTNPKSKGKSGTKSPAAPPTSHSNPSKSANEGGSHIGPASTLTHTKFEAGRQVPHRSGTVPVINIHHDSDIHPELALPHGGPQRSASPGPSLGHHVPPAHTTAPRHETGPVRSNTAPSHGQHPSVRAHLHPGSHLARPAGEEPHSPSGSSVGRGRGRGRSRSRGHARGSSRGRGNSNGSSGARTPTSGRTASGRRSPTS